MANRQTRPSRASRFAWAPEDVTIIYPDAVAAEQTMSEELHTILWSLEHVSNQKTFEEALVNVAHYLKEHPGDPLVTAAVTRVEQRLEHAT